MRWRNGLRSDESLEKTYESKYYLCIPKDDYVKPAVAVCKKIIANREKYDEIAKYVNVPPFLIGVIHYLESNFNFNSHLHNGDPLTARTVNVPAGRPVTGSPPFTFQESAIDALKEREALDDKWTVGGALYWLEAYNGFGYKRRGINTPYLWSGTNMYTKGKYREDGKFYPDLVSKQVGAVVIMRMAMLKLHVSLDITICKAMDMLLNRPIGERIYSVFQL